MLIDHIDTLELSEHHSDRYYNDLGALKRLYAGLNYLYHHIRSLEDEVAARLGPGEHQVAGNHPTFEGIPMSLIACSFHWYSVTACDYVRLVGWMTHQEDSKKALEYVKHVIPEVYLWRTKVGAHFTRSQPTKEDNAADQQLSVMNPIDYHTGSFHAGSAVFAIISPSVEDSAISKSKRSMMWSLTETHKTLAARYWPTNLGQKELVPLN